MLDLLKSMAVAFSTYSRIPMPIFEWTEENMRYSMCFFPLIGVAVGAAEILVDSICRRLGVGELLRAVLLTIVPILITGGIHMDGFLDTVDARRSYRSREEKLRILKDPNIGAFAAIYGIVLVAAEIGLFSEVKGTALVSLAFGYPVSRCLSGLSVIYFPKARKTGSLRKMADASASRCGRILLAEFCAAALGLLHWNPVDGVIILAAAVLTFLYYRKMADRQFGGTTGDLAGYFLTLCELFMLAAVALVACLA
ncbi:MAG: adenosylcobinamide-GDP ribazoletransferase [Lachnospiraceae bacterium]|nr:adenosylcobinamide-GDP ribazoletransferase [Lachnospiraceae bacterium]